MLKVADECLVDIRAITLYNKILQNKFKIKDIWLISALVEICLKFTVYLKLQEIEGLTSVNVM